ncbi:MAG TPA: hypothetical protein VHX13_00965 [Acidobacteriaceae bacterium]|jgi:hypothetical protein|nr:hypothetical protein [Acidobacteriaceae bacterium]
MKSILRAVALSGILGLGAAAAQAQVGFYARVPGRAAVVVAAVPPCPGVGYIWTPGYYGGPVFVPGRWAYRGYERPVVVPTYRGFDHHDVYRDGRRDRGDFHRR